jgi:hypothetical protein
MKLLLAIISVSAAAVSAHSSGGGIPSEYHVFKQYAEMKAKESCWGEDNMKQYQVNMKKAVAKCNQVDAPELSLPPFKSTYRFINTLLTNAEEMESNKINFIYNMMQRSNSNQDNNNNFVNMFESFMDSNGNSHHYNRNKRMAGKDSASILPGDLDIGDRLADKVKHQQEHMQESIGNMTCVLRECGVLNEQNELDAKAQKQYMNQFKVDKWLKDRIYEDIDTCVELAQGIPSDYMQSYNFPGYANMAQIKTYMKCIKYSKMRSCMYKDVKEKLETNFGPLEKILEQTQLSEDQLYPLVMNLIHGDEMELDF